MTPRGAPISGRRAPFAALAAALLLLTACGEDDTEARAQGAPPPPAVTVAAVTEEPITPSADFLGRVVATDTVDVRARVEGFLERRNFEEGQDVKKGDLLYLIEPEPYEIALEQAKAALVRAEADSLNADLQLRRGLELQQNRNIAAATVDDRRAAKASADATVLSQRAAVREAEINLGYTRITSPIDGRIGRTAFTVGNLVGQTNDVLATIVSQDPVYVTFPVSAVQVLQVRRQEIATGTTTKVIARLRLPDGSEYPATGEINFLDIRVNQDTDTLDVRATFPNPDGLLFPGQFANVTVEQGEPDERLVVPAASVQISQAGRTVLVVTADNKVESRPIVTGDQIGVNYVIQSGLRAGERVVVEGLQKVQPGQTVNATEQAAAPAAPQARG